MRKSVYGITGAILLVGALFIWGVPNEAAAAMVNINNGPPPIVVSEPPELVRVPHSSAYFVPGLEYDVFYYDGRWWQPKWSPLGTVWWWSYLFNGPYGIVSTVYVPAPVLQVPSDYRKLYYRERHIPYGEWRRHHEREERREMREERHEGGGEFRGRGEHDGGYGHER